MVITTLICIGILILAGEVCLWRLFYTKIVDMHFPPSLDCSSIRFFSIRRMHIAVIVHAVLLLISTLFPLWLLW